MIKEHCSLMRGLLSEWNALCFGGFACLNFTWKDHIKPNWSKLAEINSVLQSTFLIPRRLIFELFPQWQFTMHWLPCSPSDRPAVHTFRYVFFSTFSFKGVTCEWGVFVKACFVHVAEFWDELIIGGQNGRKSIPTSRGGRGSVGGKGLHGEGESWELVTGLLCDIYSNLFTYWHQHWCSLLSVRFSEGFLHLHTERASAFWKQG